MVDKLRPYFCSPSSTSCLPGKWVKSQKKKKLHLCLLGLGDLFPNGKEIMLSSGKRFSTLLMIVSISGDEVRPINPIHK